jgi:hypothetical protein
VELTHLALQKLDPGLTLDFNVRVTLPRVVEDALQRGVPLYFETEAAVYRPRWYWRDERVARQSRQWRLSYQPLTENYRVSLGALHTSYPTLAEALGSMTRIARWRIADANDIDPEARHTIDFRFRLDMSQLPRPFQIGAVGQAEWVILAVRNQRIVLEHSR